MKPTAVVDVLSFAALLVRQSASSYIKEFRYFWSAKLASRRQDAVEPAMRSILVRKFTHFLERYLWHPHAYTAQSGRQSAEQLRRLLSAGESSLDRRIVGWARRMLEEYDGGGTACTMCPVLIEGIKRGKPAVDTASFLRLARQRRSRRFFQDVALTEEEKLKIVEAAQLAPSACNRQTLDLIFVEQPDLKRFIASTMRGGHQFFDTAPCIVVFVSDARDYKYPEDRYAPFLDGAAAVQNVYLLCETMDLGCCWGSYTSFGNVLREAEVRTRLNIPDTHLIVAALAVGRSDQFVCDIPRDPPARRFGTDVFRHGQ